MKNKSINKKLFISFVAVFVISLIFLVSANVCKAVVFNNPIGAQDFQTLLGQILTAIQGLIVVLATIFLVIGGIMYMISAGDQGMIERGKKIMTAAIIGLVLALSANTFLVEIWRILQPVSGTAPVGTTFRTIAMNVLQFLLSLVGILGIIGMVVGGGFMLTAYGNDERVKKGKTILTYAIIGVVIAFSSLIIVSQISKLITGY